MLLERCWNYDFLRDEVKFIHLQDLVDCGWWPLPNNKRVVYTNAVKVFYFF